MVAISRALLHPPGLHSPRKPVQRALVIGINYTAGSVDGQLQCAHRDARAWCNLLKETYKYRAEDITLMLDEEGWDPALLPTKKNILVQIARLVHGLKSGDRIVFFYAGHSGQLPSDSVNEEDGFDECLQPAHHDSWSSGKSAEIILDNDLRRYLVDPLPEGASLTAVFDSCHSGTLLDLDHYLCDAVYFPWLNVVRGQSDVRVHGRRRLARGRIVKFDATIDQLSPDYVGEKRILLERSLSLELKRTISLQFQRDPQRSYTADNQYQKLKDFAFSLLKPRSESPEPINNLKCTGDCKPVKSPKVHVVSIAACKDPQQTYESRRGRSMTMDLIELLKVDPHPRCRQLVQNLGHRLHETAMKVHAASRKQLEKRKRGRHVKVLDGVNFPEPQVRLS
ncbi:hypothetical protein BV20DRAFT_1056153 [Pilatotrama ljubarskyi]|nr:hypothetical protein BV20DRAFT_1056153 [Pilatotrama ljubarskyi]